MNYHGCPISGGHYSSDSELIAMTLVGECRGWDVETELLSNMQEHTELFPCIPSQSRFNRRRRNLMFVTNLIRRTLLGWLDLAQDRQCLIDSLPVPVVQFYLVPSPTGDSLPDTFFEMTRIL